MDELQHITTGVMGLLVCVFVYEHACVVVFVCVCFRTHICV